MTLSTSITVLQAQIRDSLARLGADTDGEVITADDLEPETLKRHLRTEQVGWHDRLYRELVPHLGAEDRLDAIRILVVKDDRVEADSVFAQPDTPADEEATDETDPAQRSCSRTDGDDAVRTPVRIGPQPGGFGPTVQWK